MNAVSLGPLVMDGSRFAVVAGMIAFLIITGILSSKVDPRFNGWAWAVLIGAIVGARIGHVVMHWQSFSQEPLRMLALWQGGFYWPGAVVGLILATAFVLSGVILRLWALVPVAIAVFVWNGVGMLNGTTQAISLPQQSFQTMREKSFSFEQERTKPLVINLWASWCPPCRREMPMMAEMAAGNDQADFIFANQGEGRAAIQNYLNKNNIVLPEVILDQFSDLSRHYGAPGLPATLFITADGILKNAHLGEVSRETLQDNINRLNHSNMSSQ
ncbi:prolipoprotein diacylglyceryl transferase family protein [Brucellaceae bacterium C25G]